MSDPVTPLIIISGAIKVGQMATEVGAEAQKEESLRLMSEQRQLQYQQKTLANYSMTNKILDAQLVQATVKGISLGSPSLEAIQRETSNVSARRQRNLNIEEDIFERNALIEKENVQMTLAAQLLGDVSEFALQAAGVKKSMPKKEV